ncbi:hypothetical protein Pint_29828 [Pistacia integerrima]|uniref:Uncharacterized protein n=1 Tax=Pistacia integerrima TaxID=434235 RepID=A0ACC0X1D8_9ROSI|nr:hypothetical protein Pint_29828 [Pistacia integerrima]
MPSADCLINLKKKGQGNYTRARAYCGHTYIGIYYFEGSKPVWVANRHDALIHSSEGLVIDSYDGNLKILQDWGNPIAVISVQGAKNTVATPLDSGNFVLREINSNGTKGRVLWQSFDYPTDTLLPGMKLRFNLKTGHTWFLQSWITNDSPEPGSYTLGMNPNVTNQLIVSWLEEREFYWTIGL